jgi:hypothetical protein
MPPAQPAAPRFPAPPSSDSDLAAQLARINAEAAMAEAEPQPAPEKSGGIFSRLARKREPVPPPSPPPSGMGDAFAGNAGLTGDASMDEGLPTGAGKAPGLDASFGDASFGDAAMGDAGMGDASMGGFDPALAGEAFPDEKPRRKGGSIIALGWLTLGLIVASVIGMLVFLPGTVTSMLPGASRLYSLFGMSTASGGLALEDVRYGWTNDGTQQVLEVQGDVLNATSSPVVVPTVVIALRDETGAEISEWTTEIGEEQLGGGERAPFLRQIPSPPSNVRSVVVRFAKAK